MIRLSDCCSVRRAQEDGIALLVNRDQRGPVIAAELVMCRKTLSGLPTQQTPLRSVCAVELLHTVILAKFESRELPRCSACRGNETSSPFALSPDRGVPRILFLSSLPRGVATAALKAGGNSNEADLTPFVFFLSTQ
jgi:hypothetical protein